MQSFYSRFTQSVEKFPEHVAIELQRAAPSTELEALTYSELEQRSESVGAWLQQHGFNCGARCAILAANGPRWVTAYLGALSCAAVAVPLDTAFKPDQVAKLLFDSGSAALFADSKHREIAQQALGLLESKLKCELILLEQDSSSGTAPCLDEMFSAGSSGFEPAQSAPDQLAVILYTSGTTSDPKGVMLTHANLDAEAEAVFRFLRIDETDSILGVLPLFHALAQMANLMLPFSTGMRVVYLENLNTTELLRGLRERQITLFCCVPQFFYLIHEKIMKQVSERSPLQRRAFRLLMKISALGRSLGLNPGKLLFAKAHEALGTSMRYLVTGGSRFDLQIGRDLETLGFDILQAYGLTECCGGATLTPVNERFTGSVGRPLPSVETKIVDPKDETGIMTGEIAIRGPIIMKGYYNRPDATAQVLKDGWLHTGDLGHIDKKGSLFVTGRIKDVIVLSSGKNVYPEEIESHYLTSPWIKEMCVMGLQSKPGEPFSERLHAVVVPDLDMMREKKVVNMKEVLRFDIEGLSAQIASPKRILSYDIWQEDLPRTTTRKLKRFEIQKMVAQRQNGYSSSTLAEKKNWSAEDAEWATQPEVAKALKVIRVASKKPGDVSPTDNLELDLGLDSMERVELVVALEHALNAKADENIISEVYTVRELVEAVRAGIGSLDANVRSGWEQVFAVEATESEVIAVTEEWSITSFVWFAFGRIAWLLCKVLFRLEISGLENLPESGPFIICPNHQSFLDAPILVAQLPYRLYKDLFYVGTSEIFGGSVMRRLSKFLKLIPVDPDANLVPAMRAGAYGLKRGKILVLYPEGERSIDGSPKPFKKGAAILAVHHKVPIYPVAVEGFFETWPRGGRFKKFHRLQIAIGDPIYPPANAAESETIYEHLTAELKQRVIELWQPLHQKNVRKS